MTDLSTMYLGLKLSGPLVASSGPMTRTVEGMLKLQEAGASAVVLPSLFQEEAEAEEMQAFDLGEMGDGFAEFASSPLPDLVDDNVGTARHVKRVKDAKAALSIPVIASVNGSDTGGWVHYAKTLQEAGADALELNLAGIFTDADVTAAEIEDHYLETISAVRNEVSLPLAVKLSGGFTAFANFASRAASAGADGLVLFNQVLGSDVDLELMGMTAHVPLTNSGAIRLPMRWIGILDAQLPQLSYAATSGVHTWEDVAKLLLVGADVCMMTSATLQIGPQAVKDALDGLTAWMAEREYESVNQLRGSMNMASIKDPGAFERSLYIQTITTAPVLV